MPFAIEAGLVFWLVGCETGVHSRAGMPKFSAEGARTKQQPTTKPHGFSNTFLLTRLLSMGVRSC